jgi:hypothetical protein
MILNILQESKYDSQQEPKKEETTQRERSFLKSKEEQTRKAPARATEET